MQIFIGHNICRKGHINAQLSVLLLYREQVTVLRLLDVHRSWQIRRLALTTNHQPEYLSEQIHEKNDSYVPGSSLREVGLDHTVKTTRWVAVRHK